MKKKMIGNMVMVLVVLLIAVSGVLCVGNIKGWFDKPDETIAYLTDFRGIVTLERDGIAYTTTEDTVLRKGDIIACDLGSTVEVIVGDGYLTLGQNAKVEVEEPAVSDFSMEITGGEAFVNAVSPVHLEFAGKQIELKDAVATLSVRSGAQSISVYAGNVENAHSGQMLEWIGEEVSVRTCSIESLNDFNIAQIRKLNKIKPLCFSNEELDQLEADRWLQMAENDEADESLLKENIESEDITKPEGNTKPEETFDPEETSTPEESTQPEDTIESEDDTQPEDTAEPEDDTQPEDTRPSPVEPALTCTITIRCDTILNNWDNLEPAKAAYVPGDGCILPTVTVEFEKGETVFDVLNRICSTYGIQIEYSWTPMYDSYYIEGINNLYEFDCGYESGWMYKVNGWFPNYGCSSYALTGGENIVWCYTCVGLGADVGAERW